MSFKKVADGIYKLRGNFYYRPYRADGKRTWRALPGATLKAARRNFHKLTGSDVGASVTVGEAIAVYRAASCPDVRRVERNGGRLKAELWRCNMLVGFWNAVQCVDITAASLDEYADWRIKRAKKGHGGRAVDLEIVTLKNAVRWALRKNLLQADPFKNITVSSYRKPVVKHCRESAPRSGDELHDLAVVLFESRRSQILGWLTLITAMVGCRISEMLALRTDAKHGEPGNISNGVLWLRRKKKGANNFFMIHEDLKACLRHFDLWRQKQAPRVRNSLWWFPGKIAGQSLETQALTHALQRAGKLVAKASRTAHGLRSFYVTCRRSQGASDPQIALEMGHLSGGREIVRTYGDATPEKVHWMPSEGEPAWADEALYQIYTSTVPKSEDLSEGKITRLARKEQEQERSPENIVKGVF